MTSTDEQTWSKKFRIRWSGPYEIKEIYDNNTVDVNTLQGEPIGRVNIKNIKPYHEPLEAKSYVLEIGDTTNSSQGETIQVCMNEYPSQNTNHHDEEPSHSKIPYKFYDGQKVVRKYLAHKRIKIFFQQQKWVRPYTITRIHDDNTIEIETMHQNKLGRWRSTEILPYDLVNSNQVNSVYQEGVKTSKSLDYDEVHHKMLEYHSMQLLPNETLDENLASRVQTKTANLNTLLSTKENYYEKNAPQPYLSKNSHASTLCDFNTTMTIKENTHVKYKVAK